MGKIENQPSLEGLTDPEAFKQSVGWITDLYSQEGIFSSVEAQVRIKNGLEVAYSAIREANYIAGVFNDERGDGWFGQIRERVNNLRPRGTVYAGETVCIDGRMQKLTRFLHRLVSTFPTPGSLLAGRKNFHDQPEVLASTELRASIAGTIANGKIPLEIISTHHDFLSEEKIDSGHEPHGCGKLKAALSQKEVMIKGDKVIYDLKDLPDRGVALDLVQDARVYTEKLLQNEGAITVRRILDTRNQGMAFIGDSLFNLLASKIWEEKEYVSLGLDEIIIHHGDMKKAPQEGSLLYTPLLMREMADELKEMGFEYGSIQWNDLNELMPNIDKIVELTEKIVMPDWQTRIDARLKNLYEFTFKELLNNKDLSDDLIKELRVQVAYNVAVLYLSGFDNEENVPASFKGHMERYGIVGDKGFDFWLLQSPFLLASSESSEAVERNMATMINLMKAILPEVHGVDLEKEAMVIFVTAPVDKDSLNKETGNKARGSLIERFEMKAEALKDEIVDGRVLLVPVLVDEKTREVLEVVNDGSFYKLREEGTVSFNNL